jgi:hypothetical protein
MRPAVVMRCSLLLMAVVVPTMAGCSAILGIDDGRLAADAVDASDSSADAGSGESATFAMEMTCLRGVVPNPTATLAIALDGSAVTVARTNSTDGFDPTYTGTMSADCKSVTGTYGAGSTWTATVIGSEPLASGGCSLGTTWVARESDCVAAWIREGTPGPSGDGATLLMTEDCPSGDDPTVTLRVTVSGRNLAITSSNSTDGNDPSYTGTMSPDCSSASGTHGDAGLPWSATVAGSVLTTGGGCSLGRVWRETTSGCVAVWTSQ